MSQVQNNPSPSTPSTQSVKVDLEYARTVLRCEAQAISSLSQHVGPSFQAAGALILNLTLAGRVVVAGMGKAGIIGQKIAATFASTGTPALFMHPAEAVHGDLGMVTHHDIVLAISNSGETDELLRLLPTIKRIGSQIIALTAHPETSLARASNVVLTIGKIEEPCPLRMAPSASTTALLAMGDALALAVLKARGFTQEDFALLHPAGSLGRRLMKVSDAMRTLNQMILVQGQITVAHALTLMTKPPRNGAAVIVDDSQRIVGIFTHGDFARLILTSPQVLQDPLSKHMTSPCKFVMASALVMDAQQILHDKRINALPVVNEKMEVLGLLDIQDLV